MQNHIHTELARGNAAFHEKHYEAAIKHYVNSYVKYFSNSELSRLLHDNIILTRKKYRRERDASSRMDIAVCGWGLGHNPAGRVYTLAKLYEKFSNVNIIGSIFPAYGYDIWEPIRSTEIPKYYFVVNNPTQFLEQALKLVIAHPYDLVHLSKPRAPNIIFGLLYKLIWDAMILVDVDDEETSFVDSCSSINIEDYLKSESGLPPLADIIGSDWTRLGVALSASFDGITVANSALQERYGGVIIRHARDEQNFNPSKKLQEQNRKKFEIPRDKKVVLFFGTARKHKGLVDTIQVLKHLNCRDLMYVIVGEFSDTRLKQELQAIEGVALKFIGNQPFKDIPDIVSIGDLCILLQDPNSPAALYQTPAKLSDALGMGLKVLAESTPGLADLAELGAFNIVTRDTLLGVLKQSIANSSNLFASHPVFINQLSFSANQPILKSLVDSLTLSKPEDKLNNTLLQLVISLKGGYSVKLLQGLVSNNIEMEYRKINSLEQGCDMAETFAKSGDWINAAKYWKYTFDFYYEHMTAETLVLASQANFRVDNFLISSDMLEHAKVKAPELLCVIREIKKQYIYHTYSSWMMERMGGITDWYKNNGLISQPELSTAISLSRNYLKKLNYKIAYDDQKQHVHACLLYAEEMWSNNKNDKAVEILKEALNILEPEMPREVSKSILKGIVDIRVGNSDVNQLNELILTSMNKLDIPILSVGSWLCLRDILNWNGFFQCGNLGRNNALVLAQDNALNNPDNSYHQQLAIQAAVDLGKFDNARISLERLRYLKPGSQETSMLTAYTGLQSGDVDTFRQYWPLPENSANKKYGDFIRGKSVAIIGPAPTGQICGDEIDGFDIVLRINYGGKTKLPESREYGEKTQVSLYNAHAMRNLIAQDKLNILQELKYSLIRKNRHDLPVLMAKCGQLRLIEEPRNIFIKSLNGVPAALFDLLLFEPTKIKIFHTTFYIGNRLHASQYTLRDELDFDMFPLAKIQPVLANHDLIAQINFTRNLWINSLIQVDETCEKILQLDSCKYIYDLENQLNKM